MSETSEKKEVSADDIKVRVGDPTRITVVVTLTDALNSLSNRISDLEENK